MIRNQKVFGDMTKKEVTIMPENKRRLIVEVQ